jgi:2-polyprenyl-3-methyl-5-hydroxy-6-metoxy-1,4-benzoquinol methylase
MDNKSNFIDNILQYLKNNDFLQYKKVKINIQELTLEYPEKYQYFCGLLFDYFEKNNNSVEKVASDYLKMINDMRYEGIYFKKNKRYSCLNQQDAYLKVYSNKAIMNYYMNALLLSQVLWKHHFKMLMYFDDQLSKEFLGSTESVLDVGPGHGFFSNLVINKFPEIKRIDIVDISEESLSMTKSIIGTGGGKINYKLDDIFKLKTQEKYDLIIFGEVLEHLDQPVTVLKKLVSYLNNDGYIWMTTPTNAPAIDHVYLFRSKEDIVSLLSNADLTVAKDFGCFAEDVSEEIALKFDISYLYGAFLKNK